MATLSKRKYLVSLAAVLALVVAVLFLSVNAATRAQESPSYIREVRALEAEETDRHNPAGLAFSPQANTLLVVEAPTTGSLTPADTNIHSLSFFAKTVGSARVKAALRDPINTAFDPRFQRLLFYLAQPNRLVEVREAPDGKLQPGAITPHDVRHLGLENLQGLTVDPATGTLYFLDAAGPRLLQVFPEADGTFDQAAVTVVDLQPTGLADVRGVAFDPSSGHLHVYSPGAKRLTELTPAGQMIASRDLAESLITHSQGMVFAPSGDQTDDPVQMSLYLADSGAPGGQVAGAPEQAALDAPGAGRILEFTLAEPQAVTPTDETSTLVVTRNLAALNPPSPDSAGIAFDPGRTRLIVSDSEVEETVGGISHFQGVNVWELTLAGSVVDTANISTRSPTQLPLTNEPTGTAFNPNNGHYFFSSDAQDRVFDVNPGPDGLLATGDDSFTSFSVLGAGSGDAEGVTFDFQNNRVIVVDGVNLEVYQFTLSGSLVSQFDVARYGFIDPESVEYNPDSGTLFVMDSRRTNRVIIETTLGGSLIRAISIAASGSDKAAGLAFAPASNGSGAKRFYIVDRGIDNDDNPNLIDGKLYEMTVPGSGGPGPTNTPTNTPTATNTPTPTNTPGGPTFTPTPTNTPGGPPPNNAIYVSAASNGTIGTLSGVRDEDIAFYNGATWSLFFDGSDVGVAGADIDAFHVVDGDTVLLSFMGAVTLPVLGPVDPWDIVRFDGTSMGNTTAGSYAWYVDGSDVGLDVSADNIDALDVLPDGRVLISTSGNVTVPGVSGGRDEDLVAFTPTSLGANTSGTWALYFDGSDVGLGETSGEDTDGAAVDASGKIYLTTRNTFAVPGVSGDFTDVFVCTPGSLGATTTCSYAPTLYFDGSAWNIASNVDGLDIP